MKFKEKIVVNIPLITIKSSSETTLFPKNEEVPGGYSSRIAEILSNSENSEKSDRVSNHICFSDIKTKEVTRLGVNKLLKKEKSFHIKNMEVDSWPYYIKIGNTLTPDHIEEGIGSMITYKEERYYSKLSVQEIVDLMNEYI